MNAVTYAFGILAALLALVAIVELMRRSTLRERHAVWWLVGGVLALVIAIFPQTLTWTARLLGIAVPTNLVFFVAIGLLFLVSLQYGAELTRVEDKMRSLAALTNTIWVSARTTQIASSSRSITLASGRE